jgi:hypothetical protein
MVRRVFVGRNDPLPRERCPEGRKSPLTQTRELIYYSPIWTWQTSSCSFPFSVSTTKFLEYSSLDNCLDSGEMQSFQQRDSHNTSGTRHQVDCRIIWRTMGSICPYCTQKPHDFPLPHIDANADNVSRPKHFFRSGHFKPMIRRFDALIAEWKWRGSREWTTCADVRGYHCRWVTRDASPEWDRASIPCTRGRCRKER